MDRTVYNYDPRILHFSKDNQEINLKFKTEPGLFHHKYIPKLKVTSGLRPVPGLIWNFNTDYKNETLSIRAFKEFNHDNTVLYRAPFLNTSSNVCLGSSEFDVETFYKGDATEITDSIIKAFFDSAFTHASSQKQVIGNIMTLSHELLHMKEFPLDKLFPIDEKDLLTDFEPEIDDEDM